MKKTYITPSLFCVKLDSRSAVLQMSVNSKEIAEEDAGFVREQTSVISGRNAWDEEW
ncbi:MAG: hypothetical protein IKO73_07735 [Bacteroidaceae bacterium]|nr:hypothetical protein [Bacteroidaceae bacterium]